MPVGIKKVSLTCDVTHAAFRLCRRCTARSGGWEGIFTASRTLSRRPLAFLAARSCLVQPVAVSRLEEVNGWLLRDMARLPVDL